MRMVCRRMLVRRVRLMVLLEGRHRAGGLVGEQLLGMAIVQSCKREHITIWVLLQMAICRDLQAKRPPRLHKHNRKRERDIYGDTRIYKRLGLRSPFRGFPTSHSAWKRALSVYGLILAYSLFTLTDLYNEVGEVVPLGQVVEQQLVRDVEADLLVPELKVVDAEGGAHCGSQYIIYVWILH